MGELRIGTSGWNYPTGKGTWNGVFYPPARGRAKSFDELSFYAEYFDTVEVNSTFYGQPRAEVTRAWADRTPDGFDFSIKLYQKFTHPGMYRKRVAEKLPDDLRDEGVTAALAKPGAADLDEFRQGIEPLASRGKLGALLAQFPASFKSGDAERHYVVDLLQALHGYPVAVELRHRSWSDDIDGTLAILNAFKAGWVQIDEPKFRFSIRQNQLPNVEGLYYMRLHGRNAAKWWHHEKSEDRYNYLYTAEELRDLTSSVDAARHIVRKAYLYTNNHFSAQSVVNAAMIKEQLGEPLEKDLPERLIERHPDLAREGRKAARQRNLLDAAKVEKAR
jgi:uncharacterized protein YecE (DUF72 family)